MDDRRFDHLVRMLGSGHSRRSVLKGLLGIGGAVAGASIADSHADARALGTRPTVPPPTTRPPAPPAITTPAPCPGQVQCPNSTVCCDAGTCARSGNQAICCNGSNGHGSFVCGYECCQSEAECCDRECCPAGSVCLSSQYPVSDEEQCCPAASTCVGSGAYAGRAVCCGGDTPDCCVRDDGEPACIDAATNCCHDSECPGIPEICLIGVCLRETQTCDFESRCGDDQGCCSGQEVGEAGLCVELDQCCHSDECHRLTNGPNCLVGVCNMETHRCEAVSSCDLELGCCQVNESNVCAPIADATECVLEEGGAGICCSGECADTSLCVCSRDVECDRDRCERCFDGRCESRCNYDFPRETCDGAGTCVECLEQGDCVMLPFCNTETMTCYECQTDDFCLECQKCDQETGSCVPDPSLHGTACEIPGEGPGLSCCFGDCVASCERCTSDDDCAGCETCVQSDDPEQSHCQPCYFNYSACCFDDFCANVATNCCVTDDDCPPPECDLYQENIIRYECVAYTASGGVCEPVIDQTCDGCTSCLDTANGPICQAGCLPEYACCDGDFCQPIRTCPADCVDNDDCPGDCAYCQENGYCCDRACCPAGSICLTTQFPSSDDEGCCPTASICSGSGAFADRGVCCGGDTPDCCVREDGEPVCINPETQCCLDDECPSYPQICEIGICLRETQTCDLAWACEENEQSCCPNFEEGQVGICVDDDQCCDSGECWRLTDYPACIVGVCNLETHRCETASACDLGQGCCAEGLDGTCAPVADTTTCDLEFGGEGICCSGECADTSLCVCSRDVECDPDRCEICVRDRCTNRCQFELWTETCDGAGTCVECVEQGDCVLLPYCNTETQTCYACQDDDFCLECQKCDQETGSCVPDPSLHGTACEIPGEGPGLSCCFGDCVASCERCASDDDCAGCETCALSDDPEQSHCQPCYFEFNGCCFGDFCANIGTNCCVTDDDCPPPECDFEQEKNVIRYECVPYTASGGVCEPVIDQTCDGCASCLDTDNGPICQAGCLTGRACCEGDFCQPIRTCPADCLGDDDCPGDCAYCQENGYCGELENCEVGIATAAELEEAFIPEEECIPLDACPDGQCGPIADGCGGTIECGPCPTTSEPQDIGEPGPAICQSEGERCSSDGDCCDGLCRGRNCGDRGRKTCQSGCGSAS